MSERDVYQILRSIREKSETLDQRNRFDLHRICFRNCFLRPRSVARYMRYTENVHSTNHRPNKQHKYGSVYAHDAALSGLTAVAHGKICNRSYLQNTGEERRSTHQILSEHQVGPGYKAMRVWGRHGYCTGHDDIFRRARLRIVSLFDRRSLNQRIQTGLPVNSDSPNCGHQPPLIELRHRQSHRYSILQSLVLHLLQSFPHSISCWIMKCRLALI